MAGLLSEMAGRHARSVGPDVAGLMPALQKFIPPAEAFDHMQYSAFANSQLHRLLRRRIDTIIVTGSETDVCVLLSVLMAVDLGYRVTIARDGTCSSSDETRDALWSLQKAVRRPNRAVRCRRDH